MKRLLLLLNMGGPREMSEVEIFLKNMFNDPCILGIKNKFLRKFVAFMITKKRLKIAQGNYAHIGGKSPICDITQALCDKILSFSDRYAVDYAMNYTPPYTKDVLKKYINFDEIIVLPLYPHHSITTITSSLNSFNVAFKELGLKSNVKIIKPFYNEPRYNELIVKNILAKAKGLNLKDIDLVFSAHSLPQKIIDNGDIYEKHINDHVGRISKILEQNGAKFKSIKLAYQSRLGPMKWLKPSLNDVLKDCESKKALIYPLSFCIDNSETVFELSIEYRRITKWLGFKFYDVVYCPNDSDEFAKFILEYIME
ncbi:ferrochelatase [Campylobacter sp. faydin G-140]|uniref:ferrochelatase n=1 Tax=Campylobacter anatolicus TaxID=2829105 RepID=UPI001B996779|nr:ferrochelatase [Campylobacter anatolicus]